MSDDLAPTSSAPAPSGPAPSESSPAPTSTADHAAQVIDAFAATETRGVSEPAPDGAASVTPPPVPTPVARPPEGEAPAPPAPTLSPAARFLLEQGHASKKVDGRENWLPMSSVEKMLDRYAAQHGTTATTGAARELEQKVQQYEADRQEMYADLRGDPHAFLTKLAHHDPRYGVFLQPQAPPAPAASPSAEMPPPDLPLSDGSRTYSLEGIQQQLIPWLTQAITASIKQDLQRDRQQEAHHAQQRQQLTQANQQRVQHLLGEAATWPLFGAIAPDGNLSPFQKEVMEVYMGDKSLSLHAAYMKVALPRLTESDAEKRARIMKELNAAPKATATPRSALDAPRGNGMTSTAEIAARVLDRLERGR